MRQVWLPLVSLAVLITTCGVSVQASVFPPRRFIRTIDVPSSPLLQLRGGAATPTTQIRTTPNNITLQQNTSVETQQQQQQQLQSTTSTDNPTVLFLIKLLFLAYYGSLGALMPYLPVYYHHLGHGGQVIGMLGAVKPFTTFLVAPLWGLVADELQNPFLILEVTFLVSLVGQLLVGARRDAWWIMLMVFLTALFNAPVKSLIDSMVMDNLNDQTVYGRLRLWGQLGFGLGSSAVGILLSKSQHVPWPDTTSFSEQFEEIIAKFPLLLQSTIVYADKCWQALTGYKLLFMTYLALSVPTWILVQALKRKSHRPKEKVTKKGKQKQQNNAQQVRQGLILLLHNFDAMFFFFLVFVVGVSSGVIENFAYVRLREVGGSGKEMGLSRLVSSLAGAPMFWFSGPLTELLGADRVIVLSLLSYVVRFLIYAFMSNAYHGLPAEALRGVTFAAFWSTGTIFAHRISPPGLHATMLMVLNAMYGGLGQSIGAVIGGKLQHRYGTVKTFIYSAVVDLIITLAVIGYLSVRKSSSFRNPQPIVAKEENKQS